MPRYNIGDVVLVNFPWTNEDGTISYKIRPAIVREFSGDKERVIIQITSKNRSDKLPGIWVLKDSNEGQEMGLKADSFINVEIQAEIEFRDILRSIGTCPYMEEIERLIEENDIKRPWE